MQACAACGPISWGEPLSAGWPRALNVVSLNKVPRTRYTLVAAVPGIWKEKLPMRMTDSHRALAKPRQWLEAFPFSLSALSAMRQRNALCPAVMANGDE